MKRVLLDTHALLWFLFDDPRLSERASALIEDSATQKLVSVASLWELTIKAQLGKLELGMPLVAFFHEFINGRPIDVLPIELTQLVIYSELPLHHRDPFDRLLVAQARALRMPIVSADPSFAAYSVQTVW